MDHSKSNHIKVCGYAEIYINITVSSSDADSGLFLPDPQIWLLKFGPESG